MKTHDTVQQLPKPGQLAEALEEALDKKGMSVADLARALGKTYEYVRLLLRGMTFPSKDTQQQLCRILGMNAEEMHRLVVADKIRTKYAVEVGPQPKATEFSHIERQMRKLTAEQVMTLENLVAAMVKTNRCA